MKRRAAGTSALAALGVLYWVAHTMLRPLVGPYVLDTGGDASDASLALASFAVLPTLLAIPIGGMTDRWGARTLLSGGAAVMVLGGGMLLLPWGLAGVVASQALIGLGTIAYWVALQSVAMTPQQETTDQRNKRIATFSLFVAAGQSLGPALGGLVEAAGGYRLAFGVFTVTSVLLTGLTLMLLPRGGGQPAQADAAAQAGAAAQARGATQAGAVPRRRSLWRSYADAFGLLKNPRVQVTVAVSFTGLVILDVRMAYQPVLFASAGVAQWQIGVLLSIAAGAAFVARPFFAAAMRWLSPAWMVGLVLGTGAVSVTAVVLAPENLLLLGVLSAINGFALGFLQPLTLTLMADETPAGKQGIAAALRSFANRGAQFANPVAFGALTLVMSLSGAFVLVGAVALGVAAASVSALARHDRGPRSEPRGPE